MIVVSGVLVLVALVLLIVGLFQNSGLGFIWASIITSVVAGVFLLLGALQRRGAPAPVLADDTSGREALDRVTAVSVRPRDTEPEAEPETAGSGVQVAVVRGRPRYHVDGCRFLAGRLDVEHIDADEARAEGFTPCGVCKPDAIVDAAAESVAGTEEPAAVEETADVEPEAEPAAPARRTAAKKAPAKKTAAAASSTSTRTAAQVVVIPDRGKFHTETCRFVRDVPGTVNLTKAAAKRQGFTPCGVCKP